MVGILPIYELGGVCVPFWFHPEANAQYQAEWKRLDYYGTGSADRAALMADNTGALDLRLRMIGESQQACWDSLIQPGEIDCQAPRGPHPGARLMSTPIRYLL